ncbi:fatty acid desaturase family protein [Chryseolinea lacunae]|uniref:Fatty acid desaturase n=1 Tax=Chryseolinea lacunae TaxID=2801331 RepID=A0ABS1KUI8_9BACT|nr:fatty acid desaturase [Chryseolinea lacunae]MBL0743000.1 fatty acid desaturase [Chryseolinea lacunae]
MNSTSPTQRPTLAELGFDLLNLSSTKLLLTIGQPLLFFVLYFIFGARYYWLPGIICAMGLSFTTYGSTSHDLVHANLKINQRLNEWLLFFFEAITFRSGHAYKLSHLYHHKRYSHDDDVEGAAARMPLFRALVEGFIFQVKIYVWALSRRNSKYHQWIVVEGIVVITLAMFCVFSIPYTYVPFVYLCLMVAGSWIIPLVTSYLVHTPAGETDLHQTRLFRGKFFSLIAFDHLYHLEHHLYPMVPHKNWPELAKRLDHYFDAQGIRPLTLPGISKNQ